MANTDETHDLAPRFSPDELAEKHLNGRARYVLEKSAKYPKQGATLRHVAEFTQAELMRAKNCGSVTLNHIVEVLASAGLSLKAEPGSVASPVEPPRVSQDAWVVSVLEGVAGGVQVTLRAPGSTMTAGVGVLKLRRTVEEARSLYVGQNVRLVLEPVEAR